MRGSGPRSSRHNYGDVRVNSSADEAAAADYILDMLEGLHRLSEQQSRMGTMRAILAAGVEEARRLSSSPDDGDALSGVSMARY